MAKKSKIWEHVKTIIIVLVIALFIREFVVQAFKIPSGSMIPTLLIGDHLLVNKFIYGTKIPFTDKRILILREPERGDIIVFRHPENTGRNFIKRIIAVGGDVIESREGIVFINEEPIYEPFVNGINNLSQTSTKATGNFGPYLIPEGKFFVMGDNRGRSYDSRHWGYVSRDNIKGKAFIIYWSWNDVENSLRFERIGDVIY
ncbi:signal peptidase I [Thermodesulfovibrionales bacterium]|nr:signal peptidase I [Thermodesulfovibrionales bacterium]